MNPRVHRADVWFPKVPGEPSSIMSFAEDSHAKYRRAFMPGFTEKAVREQAGMVEGYVGLMVEKIKERCRGGEAVVNVVDRFDWCLFDISGDLSFGSGFGSTEEETGHPWVRIANTFGKGIALAASLHYYGTGKLLKKLMPEKVREKMTYHRRLTEEKVESRMEEKGRRKDWVQVIIDHNAEEKMRGREGRTLNNAEIQVNMRVIVFAASETTSSAMSATLWYLLRSQRWYDRAKEEVRSSFQSEDEISIATTGGLQVVAAIVHEAIRLSPPSVIAVPRVVGPGGETICGQFVPQGVCSPCSKLYHTAAELMQRHRRCLVSASIPPSARRRTSAMRRCSIQAAS